MARFTPTKVTLLSTALPYINQNFDKLSVLLENVVMRTGQATNSMAHDLDLNHYRILNVGTAVGTTDAISLGQVNSLISGLKGATGDQGPPGPPGLSYSTRTSMAARVNPVINDNTYLTEAGREGQFVVKDYSTVTAQVAADTTQGIYVRSTADTSKVYVRVINGWVNLKWFGIVGGNASGANGAANYAAWLAMLATLRARIPAALAPTFLYQPLEAIYVPMDWYEFAQTLDLTNGTGKIIADQTGGQSAIGTTFKFPAGQSGFRSQRYNSEGAGTTSNPTHLGGDGWLIDGISLYGGYYDTGNNGTEGEFHGFEVYSQITVKNFMIFGFQGDGINVSTNTSTSLADNCHFEYGRITKCRRGRFATGGDSNVCVYLGISYADNRTWGIEDNCFLGSTEIQPHVASNGWDGAIGSIPTACTYSGNRYYLKLGQAAGASTNAPTGTTADNTWWGYVGAGGVYNGVPAWVSGTTFREGGSIKLNNANSRMVIVGFYSESDQSPAQGISPALYLGGLGPAEQAGIAGFSAGTIGFGAGVGSKGAGIISGGSGIYKTQIGGASNDTSNAGRVLSTIHTTYEPIGMGLMWGRGVGGVTDPSNLYWNQNNSNSFLRFTPFGTTAQFGTGVAQPYYFQPINFALGPPDDTARKITVGAAAPTTGAHAAGEIVFNNGTVTAVGTTSYWQCTAAGTPGTWNAHA